MALINTTTHAKANEWLLEHHKTLKLGTVQTGLPQYNIAVDPQILTILNKHIDRFMFLLYAS
jgi:hypothetical protein